MKKVLSVLLGISLLAIGLAGVVWGVYRAIDDVNFWLLSISLLGISFIIAGATILSGKRIGEIIRWLFEAAHF